VSGPLGRLARLLAAERGRLALALLLQAATLACGMLLMATSAWLVASAALHPGIAALQLAIVGVRFFGIARGVLRYLERLVSHEATLRVLARLRNHVYARLLPLAPARLLAHRSGDLLARLVSDVETLENAFLRLAGPALAALATAGLLAALLLQRGAALAAAALAAFAWAGLAAPALSHRLARGPGARLVTLRGELQARLVDGLQGVAELLAFGRGDAHVAEVRRLAAAADAEQARLARAGGLGSGLTALGADLGALAVLALAVHALRGGELAGVQLAVVVLLTLAAFEAVAPLAPAFQAVGATREAARRVFGLLDARPEVEDLARPRPVGPAERLELRDLHFAYPDGTVALAGVELVLTRGRLVAVVGASGSGKSTLAALLLRFWEPPPGSILLDGVDVRGLRADDVRTRIAYMAQRTQLFTGTLRENLRLARPDADQAWLVTALQRAGLGSFLAALPEGLGTWLGEQGLRLSAGERQRLALARCFLRDAPLLLLDEPTAHLDALTERDVMDAVLAERHARATLLLTHRLAGLEAADEILVLDRGRVVERGPWSSLVAAGGAFAQMRAAQRAESVVALAAPFSERRPV
jgi:thiol reductant ABC exporter CydC subunit